MRVKLQVSAFFLSVSNSDFLHANFPPLLQRKTRQLASSADSSKSGESGSVTKEGVAQEEGEGVEYVDSFGRSRRCPREDLPHMKEQEVKRRERFDYTYITTNFLIPYQIMLGE